MVNGVAGEPRCSLTLSAVSPSSLCLPCSLVSAFRDLQSNFDNNSSCLAKCAKYLHFLGLALVLFYFIFVSFLIRGSPGFGSLLFLFAILEKTSRNTAHAPFP
jgi:hypothetical protein